MQYHRYVRSTVGRYVRSIVGRYSTVPDMPNIQNLLTMIGHRFSHQLGLDESSDEIIQLFCMELRSASILRFQS